MVGGCFPFNKNSGLNFRKFPVMYGTAFSVTFRKEGKIASYIEIVGNFAPRIFVSFYSWNFRG